MALEKVIKEDKIEIIGDYKIVQVRTATIIEEDGVELSRAFHRHTVSPGDDLSEQSVEVQGICNAVHTPEILAAWEARETLSGITNDESNSGE